MATSTKLDDGHPQAINHEQRGTTFDIVAVPAIGADPKSTWNFSSGRELARDTSPIRESSIFNEVDSARVYLYTHPQQSSHQQREVAFFARSLLAYVLQLPDLGQRPICFAGHSTGGLVIKRALILASSELENPEIAAMVRRCFSISFFGVPHYGSTILSSNLYKDDIAKLLKLDLPMSNLLREELNSDNQDGLERSSREFAAISIGLKKIWSFVEGQETLLTLSAVPQDEHSTDTSVHVPGTKARTTTFSKTPIVDRRSATLSTAEIEFGVEEVIELQARHDSLPRFGGLGRSQAFRRYIDELSSLAQGLSGKEAKDLEELSKKIFTDVHLFYESGQAGRTSFLKLWSEFPALYELCEKGPNKCLGRRLNSISRTILSPTKHESSIEVALDAENGISLPSVPEISIELVDEQSLDASDGSSVNSAESGDNDSKQSKETEQDKMPSPLVPEIVIEMIDDSNLSTANSASRALLPASNDHASTSVPTAKPTDTGSAAKHRKAPSNKIATETRGKDLSLNPDEAQSSKQGELLTENSQKRRSRLTRRESRRKQKLDDSTEEHPESFGWDNILDNYDPNLYDRHIKLDNNGQTADDFTLPSKDRIKFRWIHVPANNMVWAPAVLQALASELKQPSLQRTLLHRQSFNALQHLPRHKAPHGRFMNPSCEGFFPENWSLVRSHTAALRSPVDSAQMNLFFPYLHWDTLGDLKSRNDLSDRRRRQGRPYPAEPGIFESCLEHQLIWWYLNSASDLPLHIRRSLDQYGYPNLSNTKARDVDQILSKRTRPQYKTSKRLETRIAQMWDKERAKTGKKNFWKKEETKTTDQSDDSRVLMVDTLWLWVVEQQSVVTFFPSRRHGQKKGSGIDFRTSDLHDKIYNDVNGDPRFARQCSSCFDFAALAVLHATTALLERNDDPDLQVFGIFEEYLSELTELQTKSFKEFRDSQMEAETNEDAQSVRQMMASLHNRDDLTALLELRDISDELRTLDKLFADQNKVIDQMLAVCNQLSLHEEGNSRNQWPDSSASFGRDNSSGTAWQTAVKVSENGEAASNTASQAINWLNEAKAYIQGYSEHSKDIQHRCETVQEAYKLLLDMKQKQANVAEASLSRLSAEVASEQNRAIMIFTIFTIIFLPLSFFTSLFGMNVSEWSGTPSNPSFHKVFLITGCVSAGIIIIALTLAFNKPIRQKVMLFFHRSLKHWPSKIAKWGYRKVFGTCFGADRKLPSTRRVRYRDDVEREASGASSDFGISELVKVDPEKINQD